MVIENINKYLFEKIYELISNRLLDGKKIILFGLNTSSYATKTYLEENGYNIDAYIDNDERKCNEHNDIIDTDVLRIMSVQDYKSSKFVRAFSPDELLTEFDDNVVILIASKYYVQMKEQLEKLGYKEEKHIFKTADFYDLDNILKDGEWMEGLYELSIEEVKEKQLQLLERFANICDENKLRYYLCGGTLLGAIRHKGYIPWDDDIDVAMPMQDYLKFIEIAGEIKDVEAVNIYKYPNNYYNFFMRLVDKNTIMKSWEYPFLMTSGVNIDIFPLMGLPKYSDDIMKFYNKMRKLNTKFIESFIECSGNNERILNRRQNIRNTIISMMEQYLFDECEKIGYILSKYKEIEIMDRNIYSEQIEVEFENRRFKAAKGYDEYLKILFGKNYMELPSENERFTTHNFRAFYRKGENI